MDNRMNLTKELLIQFLLEGKSHRDIAKITGYGKSNIGYWIKKYNLTDLMKYKKPVYHNELMFNKIDTKEKAYIMGYSLADAYVNEKVIEFGCSLMDKEILDFVASIVGGQVRIYNTSIIEKRRFPRARFNIGNKKIITDFLKHGSAKEEKHIPIINKELERYLIQGFFDGDGCITWGIRQDRDRIWQKISFTSSLKLLEGIQKILIKQNISSTIRLKSNEKCFVLEFSSKVMVLNFLNFIYPNNNFIILKRKYNKANALRLELGEFGESKNTELSY